MKNLLITGTAGFIFSNFIRRSIYDKQPYNFISIDKVGQNHNSLYYNKNHDFHIADLRDQNIVDTIFQYTKPDIVIHGAAESSADNATLNTNDFVTSNVLATQVIINSCLKNKVDKLIYISTNEVMGQLTSNQSSWTEEQVISPRNAYAASKAAGELLIKAAHYSHDLKYNITRCSNNYGPRQTPNKLIPSIIQCIIKNKPISVYGEGLQVREWTHVFDNCSAIHEIIKSGQDNEIYNISNQYELTNIEVVNKVCELMGKGKELINFIPDPKKSHNFRYSVNTDKIKKIGWQPKISFEDGLRDTVEWYKLNQYFLK